MRSYSTIFNIVVSALTLGVPFLIQDQQTEALFNKEIHHGLYGAPAVSFSGIDGRMALLVGGQGGWIINFNQNHTFVIGGAGYSLTNEY